MLEMKNLKKNRVTGLPGIKGLLTVHKGGLALDAVRINTDTTPHQALLNRKNSTMKFMVDFLSGIGGCLDEDEILRKATSAFKSILPLRSMHVVLWNKNETDAPSLALRIATPVDTPEYQPWKEALLEQARFAIGKNFSLVEAPNFGARATVKTSAPGLPGDGPLLSIPLISADEHL
ncbi:MAG: hypothetical protein LBN33_00715, partial [Desulfovibrio sp.]|nr:hypothetical protein [Desulfovibrio sp.]